MKRMRLPYVVAVPIPTKDSKGRRLPGKKVKKAEKRMLLGFRGFFGGAKSIPSPGVYKTLSGKVIVEKDEPLVISMTTKGKYLKHKAKVETLIDSVGDDLNQESMAVIAFDGQEGGLIFMG